ncbi:MAG TPA: hypothetical protein VGM81_05955 [Burkholderiaceae bacterium]|jgi:hypothetical protein
MQKLTVTFERVFDVVRQSPGLLSHGREEKTLFGLESGQVKHYGVSILGFPRIESGMTVTALLSKADDWHSLVGWLDHATGDIAGSKRANTFAAFAVALMAACGAAVATLAGNWYGAGLFALAAVGAGVALLRFRQFNQEVSGLKHLHDPVIQIAHELQR